MIDILELSRDEAIKLGFLEEWERWQEAIRINGKIIADDINKEILRQLTKEIK